MKKIIFLFLGAILFAVMPVRAEKRDDIDHLLAKFGAAVANLDQNSWKFSYQKRFFQDGEVFIQYLSSLPDADPKMISEIPITKARYETYCAGVFAPKAEILHLIECVFDDEKQNIRKNLKVVYDGQQTSQVFFPETKSLGDALSEERPPSVLKTSSGYAWSRAFGDGKPSEVFSYYLPFGGDRERSLTDRCLAFFSQNKSVNLSQSSEGVFELRASSSEVDYTFVMDERFDFLITQIHSVTHNGLRGKTLIKYQKFGEGVRQVFFPSEISSEVQFVGKEGSAQVMTRRSCVVYELEIVSSVDLNNLLKWDFKKWNWKVFSKGN